MRQNIEDFHFRNAGGSKVGAGRTAFRVGCLSRNVQPGEKGALLARWQRDQDAMAATGRGGDG